MNCSSAGLKRDDEPTDLRAANSAYGKAEDACAGFARCSKCQLHILTRLSYYTYTHFLKIFLHFCCRGWKHRRGSRKSNIFCNPRQYRDLAAIRRLVLELLWSSRGKLEGVIWYTSCIASSVVLYFIPLLAKLFELQLSSLSDLLLILSEDLTSC